MQKRRIGIFGAGTPDGVALMRVLSVHPMAELVFVADDPWAGDWVHDRFPGLAVNVRLPFVRNEPELAEQADLVVSALRLKQAAEFLPDLIRGLPEKCRLIDLSPLFRLRDKELFHQLYDLRHPAPELTDRFSFGVTDHNLSEISTARMVAMPGPLSSAILPVLAPWAAKDVLGGVIHATVLVGPQVRGIFGGDNRGDGGGAPRETVRAARVGDHPEAFEMAQWMARGGDPKFSLTLTAITAPISSAIHSTVVLGFAGDVAMGSVDKLYRDWFAPLTFPRLVGRTPDTADVAESNRVHVHIRAVGESLIGTSVADGLGRGGAMGAVEVANAMLGLPLEAGLMFAGRSQ